MMQIFWGDSFYAVEPEKIKAKIKADVALLDIYPFSDLKSKIDVKKFMFLKQTHSNIGFSSFELLKNKPFSLDGDFLITNQRSYAIGCLTADCLPLIIYDKVNEVIAVVHAGWRGSIAQVVPNAIKKMQNDFGCNIKNMQFLFGPSAKSCCYEVSSNFENNICDVDLKRDALVKVKDKIYFDVPKYNLNLLKMQGVDLGQIDLSNNSCTICNENFCSYRRDNKKTTRQLTFAWLY